ncbi:MAG: pilus assembly protein PilM [Nitrosomonas sp.]|nr:pilus assembly protein PilM [Nitrosomonas sp.]
MKPDMELISKSLLKRLNVSFDFSLLSSGSRLVGVDISASSVKMVELAKLGKDEHAFRLEGYAIEPMPAEAIIDGNINHLEQVGECILRAWRRTGTRQKNIALALPSASVVTKKISVATGLREDDLAFQVETEANQYLPFAIDEVNLDFQVIGEIEDHPEEMEVLIAAARKDKVEDRVAAAATAGLKVTIMDVEQFVVQSIVSRIINNQLPDSGKDKVVALVDIGSSNTRINVLFNGDSIYMRDQPFGGNQLTQEIQNHFNLSVEEAETAKRKGGLPENYETDVLQPFRETLALEVSRALQFFFTSTQFAQVDHIFLSGGCAAIPGLEEIVSARTEVITQVINPFLGISHSKRISSRQLKEDAPVLLIACGLAMRGFD